MADMVSLADPRPYFEMLDRAASSHWWGRSIEYVERKWLFRTLRQLGPLRPGGCDWLDIGCGTGTRLRMWGGWPCWANCAGVEPEEEARRNVPGDSSFEIVPGALPELPPGLSRYDVITAFDVLQHVPSEQRKDAIRSMASHLRPRGILLLRTNAPRLFRSGRADDSVVAPAWLVRSLAECGLRLFRSSRFNMCGGVAEELIRLFRRSVHGNDDLGPVGTGLPQAWRRRPTGHRLAGLCSMAESRILGTGLVNFPIGHSYLVLAIKDDDHERSAKKSG